MDIQTRHLMIAVTYIREQPERMLCGRLSMGCPTDSIRVARSGEAKTLSGHMQSSTCEPFWGCCQP
jgi:hypothetical protein